MAGDPASWLDLVLLLLVAFGLASMMAGEVQAPRIYCHDYQEKVKSSELSNALKVLMVANSS